MTDQKLCSIDGCIKPVSKRQLCNMHYLRLIRHGDTSVTLRSGNGTVSEWLRSHVSFDGAECLIWPFARGHDGRGRCAGISPQAHRAMCMLVNGLPPSDTHEAAHSCGKGHEGCVHPKHLRWATPKENSQEKTEHGTQVRGSAHPCAILTKTDIPVIRSRSSESAVVLGAEYGVDPETIRNVWDGKTWR